MKNMKGMKGGKGFGPGRCRGFESTRKGEGL